MTFFRNLPPENVSPPKIFPLSTRNFSILNPKFSDELFLVIYRKNYFP